MILWSVNWGNSRCPALRVRDKARLIEDLALKEEIVNSPGLEFLNPIIAAKGYDLLSVFRVEECRAVAWTMETNLAPKEWGAP
jgi:hypothetical protein